MNQSVALKLLRNNTISLDLLKIFSKKIPHSIALVSCYFQGSVSKVSSELNHHLFTMNIIDSLLCTCGRNETTNHFFIECPQYHLHRIGLIENLTQININYNLDTLLHGTRDNLLDLQLISLLDTFITANKELVKLIITIFQKLLSCLTHWRSILYLRR